MSRLKEVRKVVEKKLNKIDDADTRNSAVGFVQSKPCLHMTYDEAVAYLQNKIAELSK